jgi:hypothetical protein
MRGISWLAAKTGKLLKKDSAPWSKYIYVWLPDSWVRLWTDVLTVVVITYLIHQAFVILNCVCSGVLGGLARHSCSIRWRVNFYLFILRFLSLFFLIFLLRSSETHFCTFSVYVLCLFWGWKYWAMNLEHDKQYWEQGVWSRELEVFKIICCYSGTNV